ncbi:MAG: helix-turn-helix domain-containing protein [Pseudomonadota bacterium]
MGLITQTQMASWMAGDGASTQIRTFGDEGTRVSASIWQQGEAEFKVGGLDFHLVEFYQKGRHRGTMEYEMETGSAEYDTVAGSLNYVQPDQSVKASFEGEAQILQIWLDRGVFTDVAASLVKGDPERQRLLGFSGIFDAVISRAATCILNEVKHPSAGGQLMIDAAAQQIAITLIRRNIEAPVAPPKKRVLSTEELSRAMAFIEDQITENKGLESLSREVGMSMYWFSHAFKATVGVSPHQFLIQRRLERSKDLLAGTKEAIASIAYDCGFSSQAHMTNAFTKHVGMSPAKYRKNVRH